MLEKLIWNNGPVVLVCRPSIWEEKKVTMVARRFRWRNQGHACVFYYADSSREDFGADACREEQAEADHFSGAWNFAYIIRGFAVSRHTSVVHERTKDVTRQNLLLVTNPTRSIRRVWSGAISSRESQELHRTACSVLNFDL